MDNNQKLQIINNIKQKIKQHPVIINLFDKHGVDIDYLDYIPMGFADLPVSARTEHGIIWFNNSLLEDGFEDDDHYMVHEITHVLQQCFGDGPTEGSYNSEDYLNNEFEQEGFQAQTEYMSDMYGKDHAEDYVEKVLTHHNVDKKDRKKKLDELLVVARDARKEDLLKLAGFPTKKAIQNPANSKLIDYISDKLGQYDKYFSIVWDYILKNTAFKDLYNVLLFVNTSFINKSKDNEPTREVLDKFNQDVKTINDNLIFNYGIREKIDDAKVTFKLFENNKHFLEFKDINQYESWYEFNEIIQKTALDQEILRQERNVDKRRNKGEEKINTETQLSAGDSTQLYEDDEVKVYRINSHAGAASLAGQDTSWCIAGGSPQYYEQYTSNNLIFYFVINKNIPSNDPLQKVAIRVIKDSDNEIIEVKCTRKTNDGDNRDPEIIPSYHNFKSIIISDALEAPESLFSKIKNGRASEEDVNKYWENQKSATLDEKMDMVEYLNLTQYHNPKIEKFINMLDVYSVSGIESLRLNEEQIKNIDIKNIDAAMAEQLVLKNNISEELFNKLVDLNYYKVNSYIAYYTKNPLLLVKLSYSTFNEVIKKVLKNTYTPEKVLIRLLFQLDYSDLEVYSDTLYSILKNISSSELLYKFATEKMSDAMEFFINIFVRGLMSNSLISSKTLIYLQKNYNRQFKDYIYELNDEMLKELLELKDPEIIDDIYYIILRRFSNSPEVMDYLLYGSPKVRYILAQKEELSDKAYEHLLNDPDEKIRNAARDTIEKNKSTDQKSNPNAYVRSSHKDILKKTAQKQPDILDLFNNTVKELKSKLGPRPQFDFSMNSIAKQLANIAVEHDELLFSQPDPDIAISAINAIYNLRENLEEGFFNKTFTSNPFQESQEQADYDIGSYEEFSQNLEPGLINQIIYEIDKSLPKSNVPRNEITESLEFSDYLPKKISHRISLLIKLAGR